MYARTSHFRNGFDKSMDGKNFGLSQGDQIGRFFAQWVIVYSGHFLKITRVARIVWLLFPQIRFCNNFDKNGIGLQFGRFLTYSSGHPGLS
jgi:hypothetical protein